MLPSNEPSGLLSASMIIPDGFLTRVSLMQPLRSVAPPSPNRPPASVLACFRFRAPEGGRAQCSEKGDEGNGQE